MPDIDACMRECIYEGLEVDIVLKRDQKTGKLTRGIVDRLLTRKSRHPRGIKVKLKQTHPNQVETDLVGRCVHLYEKFDDEDLRPVQPHVSN